MGLLLYLALDMLHDFFLLFRVKPSYICVSLEPSHLFAGVDT